MKSELKSEIGGINEKLDTLKATSTEDEGQFSKVFNLLTSPAECKNSVFVVILPSSENFHGKTNCTKFN